MINEKLTKELQEQITENKNDISKIGKLLWNGSFETGTLHVPKISDYTMIAIKSNNLLMVGNQRYGGMVITAYTTLHTTSYGYRYTYNENDETLKTDNEQTGATDGNNRIPITEIYGIF